MDASYKMVDKDPRTQLLHDMQHTRGITLPALRRLRQRVRVWLDAHPDDQEVLGCGEGLKMLEDALLLEEDETAMD